MSSIPGSIYSDTSPLRGGSCDYGASIATGSSTLGSGRFLYDVLESCSLRQVLYQICESKFFTFGILAIIIINTVVLALQSGGQLKLDYGWYFSWLDCVFLGVYVMEAIIKIFVYRLRMVREGWNAFDLFIVSTSLVTLLLPLWASDVTAANSEIFRLFRLFRAIRAVRSLRVLKTIRFFNSLQMVVTTLLKSLPAMGNICLLTLLVMYTSAVIAMSLFAPADPARFEGIGRTSWTLFQLATLDNWSAIYVDNKVKIPGIFAFTFIYIILVNFVFINLFVAVIVDNMQSAQTRAQKASKEQRRNGVFHENSYDVYASSSHADVSAIEITQPHSEGAEDYLREELGIDNYYSSSKSDNVKREFSRYFMLLASLESSALLRQRYQKILDDIIGMIDDRKPPGGER